MRSYSHPISTLGERDLRRYFANPVGYVFVTLFVFLSAAAAFWQPRFFLNNLATLDQLNQVFPYLLVFFVPTLTMGAWTDEYRQGTDELLLTLPCTERDLVLGKYAASLGVYTVAILLSLSHVLVLSWLGDPDRGLLAATFFGYLLAGAALIPIGMFASLLTANAAVAFVLGSMFCALPIALSAGVSAFDVTLGRRLAPVNIFEHFSEFGAGVISLTGVLYFVFLAAFFIHLNLVTVARRRARVPAWIHHSVRALALAVILITVTNIIARAHTRLDLTTERIHSLSGDTRFLLDALPSDRPVLIQAFISREMPTLYVQTRESLLAVLRGIDAVGGANVTVVIENTAPFSAQARLARERYRINPRVVPNEVSGGVDYVYLGVVLSAGPDEQIIPFFERGLSAEYEIARTIRVLTHGSRKRIGMIDGGAKMLGGVDFRSGQSGLAWGIVDELRKQYHVLEVTPGGLASERLDGLVLVLPSTLTQTEMEQVLDVIKKGTPTLVLVDPLPITNIDLAPAAPIAAQIDPYRTGTTVQQNFGDVRGMLVDLGVNWVPARIVWDSSNPHPDMTQLPPEAVFIGSSNGNERAFNPDHPSTEGLDEVLMMYPGYLLEADSEAFSFEPLLETGRLSGTVGFFQATRPSPDGLALAPSIVHEPDDRQYVLAAHIRAQRREGDGNRSNVIVIGDLDFISDYFFQIRATAPDNVNFDNVNLFLNAIDVLVGDEGFIALRRQRVRHRTLERVEAQTRQFMEQRAREEQQAQEQARAALDAARNRLKARVEEIQAREDLDELARQILVRNLQTAETRRLQVLETNINFERDAKIHASRETMEMQVRRIRGAIRATAVLLPPLPILLLGLAIFLRQRRRERQSAEAVGQLAPENL